MQMRWSGFRKVRRQVCRRIQRRMQVLEKDVQGYREFLEAEPEEWDVLDALCRITISRFYRDRAVFAYLQTTVLPALAEAAAGRGDTVIRAWSVGCASGEEAYSLAVMWQLALSETLPRLDLCVLATDASQEMIARARAACYSASSLKELPRQWRERAFDAVPPLFRLQKPYRDVVEFRREDVRANMPDGPFDLILCRNVAFTYFDEPLQRKMLLGFSERLHPGGAMVIGSHETLPAAATPLTTWSKQRRIYRTRFSTYSDVMASSSAP
jgi:chemotaxis protein methyltransferase CheR